VINYFTLVINKSIVDVDQLLGNDGEINNYTTVIIRQRSLNCKRGTAFSVRFVPRCYKQLGEAGS
jgi:hypothetical protein